MNRRLMLLPLALLLASLLALPVAARAAEEPESAAPAGETAAAKKEKAEPKAELVPSPLDPQAWYQAGFVAIVFLVVFGILYPTAWKPALAGLLKREQRIRSDRGGADAAHANAEALLKQYAAQIAATEAQVRDLVNAAQVEGDKAATAIRMKAQSEAEDAKERAQKEIDQNKTAALENARGQIATLATSIASKVLRRELSADQQQDLVPTRIGGEA